MSEEKQKMSYEELEFRLKRETEKRLEAEENLKVEEAKGQRRQLMIIAILKRLPALEHGGVDIEKTELAAAMEAKVEIVPSSDKFTITVK